MENSQGVPSNYNYNYYENQSSVDSLSENNLKFYLKIHSISGAVLSLINFIIQIAILYVCDEIYVIWIILFFITNLYFHLYKIYIGIFLKQNILKYFLN